MALDFTTLKKSLYFAISEATFQNVVVLRDFRLRSNQSKSRCTSRFQKQPVKTGFGLHDFRSNQSKSRCISRFQRQPVKTGFGLHDFRSNQSKRLWISRFQKQPVKKTLDFTISEAASQKVFHDFRSNQSKSFWTS